MNGGKRTIYFTNINEKSQLLQKIEIPNQQKPCKSMIQEWNCFLIWLESQTVYTIWDFRSQAEYKYSLSSDEIYFKEIIRENQHNLYIKMSNRANQVIYRLTIQTIEQ